MYFSARRALRAINDELTNFYQPIIDNITSAVGGCMVSPRWLNPSKGVCSPEELLGQVDKLGLTEVYIRQLLSMMINDLFTFDFQVPGAFLLMISISPALILSPSFRIYLLTLNIWLSNKGITPVFGVSPLAGESFSEAEKNALNDFVDNGVHFSMNYPCHHVPETTPPSFLRVNHRDFSHDFLESLSSSYSYTPLRRAQQKGVKLIAENIDSSCVASIAGKSCVDFLMGEHFGGGMPFDLFRYRFLH
ncbi:TPA: EAL domain-containing protein [Salmonella enterica subsp. enterica serovar Muenchen]|nr:EAL domain-containing protein [Salmonella enterica subsp. enterica serovar Muenchen]HEC8860552.1 EAL domain-containing protein [Salmonella enterica subsp. enterica serovar Muenchen]